MPKRRKLHIDSPAKHFVIGLFHLTVPNEVKSRQDIHFKPPQLPAAAKVPRSRSSPTRPCPQVHFRKKTLPRRCPATPQTALPPSSRYSYPPKPPHPP